MAMNKLRVGSLFSGAGMLDLGLEWAGMETIFQVEIDPWNQHLLEKNFPNTIKYTDIKEVDCEDLPRVDVLAGGFPCQPVSIAGKKKAQEDERWLWPEFARIIRGLRPRFVLVENVPGLLGRGFGEVLADLSTLGYDAEWTTFPAAFVGSPHQRDRLWLVAYSNIERWNGWTGNIGEASGRNEPSDSSNNLADTSSERGSSGLSEATSRGEWKQASSEVLDNESGGRREGSTEDLADSKGIGVEGYRTDWFVIPPAPIITEIFRRYRTGRGADYWATEPELGRLAHGTPRRVHRLWSLGNGVVPQVAEVIGRLIVDANNKAS
jgi:DNA (cytosine-5)-methyltransferase 1